MLHGAAEFRELVSGQRRGVAAALLRTLLSVAEMPYRLVVTLRNAAYDRRWRSVHRVDVPVVSIGNITMGGTGKTPVVGWIATWLCDRGFQVGLISRGYHARSGAPNDEARELALRLPDVPHVQNPDRVAAARQLIVENGCRVLVLDDAFQHRRIHRDVNVVLIDATEPFGFGHVFPRGALREPLDGLRRADLLVLSRADAVSAEQRMRIREHAERFAPNADWVEIAQRPEQLRDVDGNSHAVNWLQGKRVAAFCGLGNPAGFRHTIDSCECQVVGFREFPDHHEYSAADLIELDRWLAGMPDAEAVLCTQKDLVKLDRLRIGDRSLYAITIGIEFLTSNRPLVARLESLC